MPTRVRFDYHHRMALEEQTARSITWSIASGIAQRVVSLACTVVLARMLDPATFGMFALAVLTVDAFGLFKSLGLDSALIQRREEVPEAADTAFIAIPVLGALIYVLLLLTSPLIGKALGSPDLVPVLNALGLVFVMGCLARVPTALLEKRLAFGALSLAELVGSLLFSVSAVVLAAMGFKIWSLVYAFLLRTVVYSVMVWVSARWRPRLRWNGRLAAELFRFGRFQFLDTIAWFLRRNLDNVLVGWLLGVTRLGLYSMAFNLSNLLVEYFGSKVIRVMYPACSVIQDRLPAVQAAFSRMQKYVVLIAVPFGVVLSVLGSDVVRIVLGEKWMEAVPSLRILTWGGVFNTLAAPAGAIFLALGRPKLSFRVTLLTVLIFLGLIVPASRFGLAGVSLVVTLGYGAGLVLSYVYAGRLLQLPAREVLRPFRSGVLVSACVLALWVALRVTVVESLGRVSPYARFPIELVLAGLLFLAGLYLLDRDVLREGPRLVLSVLRGERSQRLVQAEPAS
jgi:O-antigen/teichoic acid export membrane protein